MRNMIDIENILPDGTPKHEYINSKVLLKDREIWLDELLDNDLADTAVKLRDTNILKNGDSYRQMATHFFTKLFKDNGAEAVPPSDPRSALPDIKFTKNKNNVTAQLSADNPLGANVQLATYDNSILSTNSMIIGIYDQITPNNASPIMQEFPEALYPAPRLFIPSFAPIAGMTSERRMGEPFSVVEQRKINYQEYSTENFAEKAVWYPEETIGLRDPSSNSFMAKAFPILLSKSLEQLSHRRDTRTIFNIYRAAYDGVIFYSGKPQSYDINPVNRLTGTQLGGAPWATFSSTGLITSVGSINVLIALRNFAHGIAARYTGFKFNWYMNSMTLSAILASPSITPVSNFGPGFQVGQNPNLAGAKQLESIINQFLGTSANISIIVDDSQYYPDAYDPLGRAASTTQSYYLNDIGKILVCPQVQSTGKGIGEYAYTPVIQNGGMYNPQPGAAFFMIDTFASNTTEGMENPSLSQALTYNALPLIFRNNDIYSIDITQ